MTDRIEPALTPEEWGILRECVMSNEGVAAWLDDCYAPDGVGAVRIMAAMNFRLPDTDPRKITRVMTTIIREAAKRIGREGNPYLGFEENLTRYADALEFYLPPE